MNEADFLRALSEDMRRATDQLVAEHKGQLAAALARAERLRVALRGLVAAFRCCSVEGCYRPATRRRPSQYLPDCCDIHDDVPGLRQDALEAPEIRAALAALEDGT